MPIYVYRCDCGERFERIVGLDAPAPGCPACGGTPQKIPAGPSLLGQAGTGLAKEQMPQTWRGTYNGNREYVTGLRRQWDQRQKLEAKHPELAGDQRPIIAHEGRFHGAPLRAGDPTPGHGHGHGHGHGPAKPAEGGSGKPHSGPAKP
jgi:putative FmdB family regulatory protein